MFHFIIILVVCIICAKSTLDLEPVVGYEKKKKKVKIKYFGPMVHKSALATRLLVSCQDILQAIALYHILALVHT